MADTQTATRTEGKETRTANEKTDKTLAKMAVRPGPPRHETDPMNQEEMVALAITELAEYNRTIVPIGEDFTFDASVKFASNLAQQTGLSALRIDLTYDENGQRFLVISDNSTLLTDFKRWMSSKLN